MTDSHPPEAGASLALSINPDDVWPYDVQPHDVSPQDVRPHDARPQDVQPQDIPPNDIRPNDARPNTVRPVLHDANLGRPPHTAPNPPGPLVAPWLDNNLSEAATGRHDGWTPERKRLFHETLAEVGVVSEAARAAGMSARAAYNLRNRDTLFDAGWEAALLLARRRLADDLYARAVNGVVEQIHKDGAIVAERHKYDNRLSMAVLTRLDARVDRAEAYASGPQSGPAPTSGPAPKSAPTPKSASALTSASAKLAARWDEYLDALGTDRLEDALALLAPPAPPSPPPTDLAPANPAQTAQHRGHHELQPEDRDLHSVWRGDDRRLWTNYPPPPGFDPVHEDGRYPEDGYRRKLTADERAATAFMPEFAEHVTADMIHPDMHEQRDAFFAVTDPDLADEADDDEPCTDEPDTDEAEDNDHYESDNEPAPTLAPRTPPAIAPATGHDFP